MNYLKNGLSKMAIFKMDYPKWHSKNWDDDELSNSTHDLQTNPYECEMSGLFFTPYPWADELGLDTKTWWKKMALGQVEKE